MAKTSAGGGKRKGGRLSEVLAAGHLREVLASYNE